MELRPAVRKLGMVQKGVVEAVLLEGDGVALHVARADLLGVPLLRCLYNEASGFKEHLYARLLLELVEGLVGVRGEGGVLGLVLG
jgi:hypothetical protein